MSVVSNVGVEGTRSSWRGPGWLLALSPIVFAAVAVVAAVGGTSSMTSMTGAEIPVAAWVAFHVLYATALGMGGWALAVVGRRLGQWWGRVVPVLAILAVLAGAVAAVLRLVMLGSGGQELGSMVIFPAALVCSVVAVWLALAATAVAGLGLSRTGVLRRVGAVVAVVAVLHLLADVVIGGGLPPFLVSVWWLVLGIALLGRRVPSA